MSLTQAQAAVVDEAFRLIETSHTVMETWGAKTALTEAAAGHPPHLTEEARTVLRATFRETLRACRRAQAALEESASREVSETADIATQATHSARLHEEARSRGPLNEAVSKVIESLEERPLEDRSASERETLARESVAALFANHPNRLPGRWAQIGAPKPAR